MFRRAYSSGFTQRPDLTVMGAFSGLEIACWDILGKARGRPVWALLGGRMNDRIRAYTYLYPGPNHPMPEFWGDADMAAEAAADLVARGYTAREVRPRRPLHDPRRPQPAMHDIAARSPSAPDPRGGGRPRRPSLRHAWPVLRPRRDPARAGDRALPAALVRGTRAARQRPGHGRGRPRRPRPVAAGERLTTRAEFAALLRAGGARILQPALGRAGGIWEARKIAALAESYGAEVAPHLYAGPVEWAANIHLAAAIPNFLMAETIETPFHDALIRGSIRVEDGHIPVPETPGLGIEVDEALARAHPYTGEGLHLEMQEAPNTYAVRPTG
jgi:galactonate dehydratase